MVIPEEWLQPNIAVHCDTFEKAKTSLDSAHCLGYSWCDGTPYLNDYCWDIHGSNTVYCLHSGEYGNKKAIFFTIVPFYRQVRW